MEKRTRDENRDPITGQPGSHPVGTGVGSAGGAAIGAAIGAPFGPIGFLVGGAIGAVAGGGAGHAVGERMDPTFENEYWRTEHRNRPYIEKNLDYDRDYAPAYRFGLDSHSRYRDRRWDDSLESDLRSDWEKNRGTSSLKWEQAKNAVKDAFDRSDRTYRAYADTDRTWRDKYNTTDYFESGHDYDRDYAPAYRYGTYSRQAYAGRNWDSTLEHDLERNWDKVKGNSRLTWDRAKLAVRDAWHGVERKMPGDADRDGR
ncbi:MAG: hypothetical protein ACYC7A_18125 [Thermoanaerobaculia bacterium]